MTRSLILALLLCGSAFGQTDQYGGYTAMPSPNPSTGQFRTEKFGNKWMFVDPANNSYFMIGTYALNEDTSVDDMGNSYFNRTNAKYGDTGPTWGPAQLNRTMAWGFNSVGPYASSYVQPVTTDSRWPADHSNPVKVPFVGLVRPAYYGMSNQNNWAPQPIKNMMYAVSSFYNGYNSSNGVADYYDGNFDTFMTNELANDSGLAPIKASAYKQYLIGMNADDGDEMYGFGDGPDFVNGHNNANLGWIVLTMSPLQTANSAMRNLTSSGGTGFVYADTTVYSKAALVTQLTTKYGTIGALNTAWGSIYTTFGSSGTTRAAESVGTGNGSALTFSHTLANAAVSKYSLQIFVSGVAVGGDIGNGTVWGPNLSGTVTYSSGVMSLTFTAGHAPANTAPITASYVQNGWGIGTGLLDEDGRVSHQGWVGTDFVFMTNVNPNTTTDLNAFLAAIAGHYFSSCNTHLKAWIPGVLYLGPDTLGTWSAPSNRNVLTAAASYIDVMAMGLGGSPEDLSQTMLDFIHTYYGDKPFYAGQFRVANPDSALYRYTQSSQFSTQALRGTDYYNSVTTYPAAAYTATGTQPYIGILWWQYLDNWGEKNDWGLVSLSDNAYDGNEAVMGGGGINCAITHTCTVTCSAPLATYKCGGEERNYGNVITSVTTAHKQIQTLLLQPVQNTVCTSTATIPPPTVAPFSGLLGAGTYVANPEPANYASTGCFGLKNPILRVSDGNSAFAACAAQGGSCTGKQNRSMFVASSDGSDNHFTLNDQQFVVVDSGNSAIIYDNNFPAVPTARYVGFPDFALRWGQTMPVASWTKAETFLAMANSTGTANGTILSYYDTSTTWPTLPARTTIIDFASSVNGVPSGAVNQTDPITCNKTETICGTGFSTTVGQGSSGACYVGVWTQGSGFSVWNTCVPTVTGDYGSTGAAVCQNCAGAPISPGTFNIHNVKFSQDMTWAIVQVTPASCVGCLNQTDPYFWRVGTTQIYTSCPTPSTQCSGHFVSNGQLDFINEYSTPNWVAKLFGSTTGITFPVGTTCAQQHDQHASWLNNNLTDTNPFFGSTTWSTSNPVYTSCGVDEIDAWDPPSIGDNLVFRYAHNYGAPVTEFAGHEQLAAVSPTGKYVLMTSPMANSSTFIGQLGGTNGVYPAASTAISRSDVFMVQVGGSVPVSTNPFWGFTETNTAASNFPTVPFKMQRIWDSPPLQWPSLNTAAGVFSFTNLDTMLAQDYSNSVSEIMYTLARTPPWASSQPTNATCNYQLPVVGGGMGECAPPSDLNADGSGTDAIWKAWITKIAQHANGQDGNPTYLTNHAHIRYWEIWNEPDATGYWVGSFAQLARLTEDANCIITGRGVIHQSGNGSATTCTATAIDPTAQIVMSSGHASSAATLNYAQNQLYCNNTSGIPSYQLPCPNPATATSAALDIINFHLKPGNASGNNCPAPSTPCTVETAMAQYVVKIDGVLQTAELAKPLWDGEMSYAIQGFVAPYNTPDMCSSFVARMYMTMWSLNISGSALYTWDNLKAQGKQCLVAYQQTYGYIQGSTLTVPCISAGTVWSCTLTQNGVARLVMWDSSQACTGTSCPTSPQTVPNQWGAYQDMTSVSTPQTILNHSVPVGIKPVILQIGGSASGPAPATALFATVSRNQQVNSVGGSK